MRPSRSGRSELPAGPLVVVRPPGPARPAAAPGAPAGRFRHRGYPARMAGTGKTGCELHILAAAVQMRSTTHLGWAAPRARGGCATCPRRPSCRGRRRAGGWRGRPRCAPAGRSTTPTARRSTGCCATCGSRRCRQSVKRHYGANTPIAAEEHHCIAFRRERMAKGQFLSRKAMCFWAVAASFNWRGRGQWSPTTIWSCSGSRSSALLLLEARW